MKRLVLAPISTAPTRWQMPGAPVPEPLPPTFISWADYLARTTPSERMRRCYAAAKKANRKRLLSAAPLTRLSGCDVWDVIEASKGRCTYCGSLAVENRPSHPVTGAPLPWAQVGRRIGSLEHNRSRIAGGDNNFDNLAWACLWCNTWPTERRPGAKDHGGLHPVDDVGEDEPAERVKLSSAERTLIKELYEYTDGSITVCELTLSTYSAAVRYLQSLSPNRRAEFIENMKEAVCEEWHDDEPLAEMDEGVQFG